MEAVAERARISKPSLYLRYPSKAALVFEAIFGKTKSVALPDTGYLIADLQEAYDWAVDEFAAPEAYARVHGLVERAQRRGEMRPDADLTSSPGQRSLERPSWTTLSTTHSAPDWSNCSWQVRRHDRPTLDRRLPGSSCFGVL